MGNPIWLTLGIVCASFAETRPDFPLSGLEFGKKDKQFLFETLRAQTPPQMLKTIGAEWRVITWPLAAFAPTEEHEFMHMLKKQLSSETLGVFVASEARPRPLHQVSVLAFAAPPSRATILHEVIHAMLHRLRPDRRSVMEEELEIVSFLQLHREALALEDTELLPQIENLLRSLGHARKRDAWVNHTIRRLGRFAACTRNLTEGD